MKGLKKITRLQAENRKIIGFDIDGTLTDFSGFLEKYAPEYMQKRHGLTLKNKNGYDIDELYDLKTQNGAETPIAKQFWNRHYLQYCFKFPMRKEAAEVIRELKRKYVIVIFTSRNRACRKGVMGWFVRTSTRFQLLINGVIPSAFLFFETDEEKCQMINSMSLAAMVDDKPEVLAKIKYCQKFCVASTYNISVKGCVRVKKLDEILEYI